MSDDVFEMEDARTEYGLPKIWVKLVGAYTADTRLSASSPPHTLLESLLAQNMLYRFLSMFELTAVCEVGRYSAS